MDTINLKFMIEKREGYGEDSAPLFLVRDNFCAIGVFDGMGGSGAATCKSDFGDGHTKAYVASRIIKEAVDNYINNAKSTSEICAENIRKAAKSRLEQEKSNFPLKASGLRSKLVREYPTTLAIVTCEQKEDGESTINSYWAGDSRNYLWNSKGFFQISKDDLDTELDPLENLRNDGALSNCVCADRDFEINSKSITISGAFIILCATDGCFGYFPTPMHFHEVLLTGLKLSKDENEWENFIQKKISNVTGDDISLSLCAIGYKDFKSLKASFENETIDGFDDLENLKKEIDNIKKTIEQKKAELEEKIQSGWNSYKVNYMKFINTPEHEVELNKESAKDVNDAYCTSTNGTFPNSLETKFDDVKSKCNTEKFVHSIDDGIKASTTEIEEDKRADTASPFPKSGDDISTLITAFEKEPSISYAKQLIICFLNTKETLPQSIKEKIEQILKKL